MRRAIGREGRSHGVEQTLYVQIRTGALDPIVKSDAQRLTERWARVVQYGQAHQAQLSRWKISRERRLRYIGGAAIDHVSGQYRIQAGDTGGGTTGEADKQRTWSRSIVDQAGRLRTRSHVHYSCACLPVLLSAKLLVCLAAHYTRYQPRQRADVVLAAKVAKVNERGLIAHTGEDEILSFVRNIYERVVKPVLLLIAAQDKAGLPKKSAFAPCFPRF